MKTAMKTLLTKRAAGKTAGLFLLLLAACLLALPTLAGEPAGEGDGEEGTRAVFIDEDGHKHVVSDVERHVWLSHDGDGEGEEGKAKVRVVVVDDATGEPQTFEWSSEDGEPMVLEDGVVRFGEGAEGLVHLEDMVARGFLGVQLVELTPELRQHFGVPAGQGVLVGKVEPDSPAQAAGIRVGDVITALDGEMMDSSRGIRRHVRPLEDGETLAVEVYRDGSRMDLNATVVERERPEMDIRHLMGRAEGPHAFTYRIDRERMGDVLHEVQEHLASPEFQWRVDTFRNREQELEERLQQLEEKLQQLQQQLEEQNR